MVLLQAEGRTWGAAQGHSRAGCNLLAPALDRPRQRTVLQVCAWPWLDGAPDIVACSAPSLAEVRLR